MIAAAFAPELPFERKDDSGDYAPLANIQALVILEPPASGATSMGVQASDITVFTQTGIAYVQRGSDLRAGDRLTFQARKYVLMGARNWDFDHPMTGENLGWMTFAIEVDAAQLIADLLALRGQQITLIPIVGTEQPGGGFRYADGTPRDPQPFVLINTKGIDGREDGQTDRDLVRKSEFQLVGAADAAIALGDHWEDDVAEYTVESIDRTKPYNVEALVVGFLKVAGHAFG